MHLYCVMCFLRLIAVGTKLQDTRYLLLPYVSSNIQPEKSSRLLRSLNVAARIRHTTGQ